MYPPLVSGPRGRGGLSACAWPPHLPVPGA